MTEAGQVQSARGGYGPPLTARPIRRDPTPESASARELIGNVPTSDSGLLAALVAHSLNEIERQSRRARLDAAYADLAEAMAEEAGERRVDSELALAALTYAVGADDTE